MRKAKNVEMLPSSHSKSFNSVTLLITFLFIYYGIPQIFFLLPISPTNEVITILLIFLPPLILLGVIKILCGTIFIKWQNFLRLQYWELIKTAFPNILGALGVNVIWVILLTALGLTYETPAIETFLQNGSAAIIISISILAVIIAPVVEELTFREVIYSGIQEHANEKWSMVITSLLFAVAHDEFWQIPGLFMLGYLFQRQKNHYKNIESAIFTHSFNNFLAMMLFFLAKFLIKS